MSSPYPVHYRIHLEPDLQRFQFSGRTEIVLKAESMAAEVTLNALELAVWTCQVKRGEQLVPCAFQMDPEKEELKIRLPESVSGQFVLVILYQGHINDRMAGFYRSTYAHQEIDAGYAHYKEYDASNTVSNAFQYFSSRTSG